MKIFFSQIYGEPEVSYPFSSRFQLWLGDEISSRIVPSSYFLNKYSANHRLIFRISAKAELEEVKIVGPRVFRKSKDVEYTIFLTYNKNDALATALHQALHQIFLGIRRVLEKLEIDPAVVVAMENIWVDEVLSDSKMFFFWGEKEPTGQP